MKPFDKMSYEELRDALCELPMTWYPDLIRAMVEASLSKGAWHPMMAASKFVYSVESNWKKNKGCPSCKR